MPEKPYTLSTNDGVYYKTPDSFGLTFERIFDQPVSRVWAALTEPDQLAKWLAPTTIEGREGGTITLHLTGGTMGGKILKWKKNEIVEYVWHNGSSVRWQLLSEGKGRTRLVFTHRKVLESQLVDAAKGWHYHLDALTLILEGKKVPENPVETWDEMTKDATKRYKAALQELLPLPAPFVIERVLDAPIERVWHALTNKDEIKHWSFEIAEFEPEEGFEFTFYGEHEGTRFVHFCRITEVVDERKLAYSWRYENVRGVSHVTWELFPEGGKTRLRLTHEGLENFAHAGAHYLRSNFVAGWTDIIGRSLVSWLKEAPMALAR
jgi:uncharacterized protein YndB with AHSA1/START domain